MSRSEPRPGDVLAQRYRIDRELGRGGMGCVLAATHVDLGTPVAVKILTVDGKQADGAVGRFLQEARAAARLRSEFIAKVSDFGTLDDGRPFMVLEHLEGEDWARVLSHRPSTEEVVDAICQVCAGLAEAHVAGIVHRDLKPSNLFRTRRPDGSSCTKILDFGVSKLSAQASESALVSTTASAILGTPLYMSPEQVRSTRDVDPRSDVWALGVVLAEALTGAPPFAGASLGQVFSMILESPPTFRAPIPPDLRAVVDRCLRKSADDRYADVGDLAAALATFASVEGQDAARRARATFTARPRQPSLPEARAAVARSIPSEVETLATTQDVGSAAPVGILTALGNADTKALSRRPAPLPPARRSGPWVAAAAALTVGAVAFYVVAGRRDLAAPPAASAVAPAAPVQTSAEPVRPALPSAPRDAPSAAPPVVLPRGPAAPVGPRPSARPAASPAPRASSPPHAPSSPARPTLD